jgi:hypothetical protein
MPSVGFGPTIRGCEQVKTVHTLERTATVTGTNYVNISHNYAVCNSHNIHFSLFRIHAFRRLCPPHFCYYCLQFVITNIVLVIPDVMFRFLT